MCFVFFIAVQKYHTVDGRRCEVKKALSKMEMRSLKCDAGYQNQHNMWPAGGHCGPGTGVGNMCFAGRNFVSNCSVGGYVQNCSGMGGFGGPQGPNLSNYGASINNVNHGGWSISSC